MWCDMQYSMSNPRLHLVYDQGRSDEDDAGNCELQQIMDIGVKSHFNKTPNELSTVAHICAGKKSRCHSIQFYFYVKPEGREH